MIVSLENRFARPLLWSPGRLFTAFCVPVPVQDGTVFDSSEGALRHHVLDNFAVSILNLVQQRGWNCRSALWADTPVRSTIWPERSL